MGNGMLRRAFVAAMQRVFFPGLKVPPKPSWVESVTGLGPTEGFVVERRGGSLSCLRVRGTEDGTPSGTVVLLHPISRKAKYYFGEGSRIKFYLDNHFDVVLFDFNGFGESDRIDFDYWRDAKAVFDHVGAGGAPLMVHGVSFGCFHMTKALDTLTAHSFVVLENLSRSFYDYWKRWFLTRSLISLFLLVRARPIVEVDPRVIFKGMERPDMTFLFIVCEADEYTPRDEMIDAAGYLDGDKTLVVVPNAGHLEAPAVAPELYFDALGTFSRRYKECLQRAGH